MKACRCPNCGQVFPMVKLLVVAAPEGADITLEDDEPPEWMCPICFAIEVAAVWDWFYQPGEPQLIEATKVAGVKIVQGELF